MTNSILITKYILKILESNKDLKKLIPIKNIYPIDAKLGTKFPFAVIQRTSLMPASCKDGTYQDTVNFTIVVVDDNYIGCVTIANEIRKTLEGYGWRDDYMFVHDIRLTSASETIYNDTNIQQLEFTAVCD